MARSSKFRIKGKRDHTLCGGKTKALISCAFVFAYAKSRFSHEAGHIFLMYHLDGDEPLLSGSGMVSKEITDENLLEAWHDVLKKWHQNLSQRPKQVHHLSRKGIPEALRGEVWQLLTGCQNSQELQEDYRILMTKVGCRGCNIFSLNFISSV